MALNGRDVPLSLQTCSFTSPNSKWLDRKVNVEHEYRSNSEAVNDLIRKAREIEAIRAQLIHAEQSGFTDLSREEIRAEIREELRRSGNYRISEDAKADLQRIYRHGVREFGEEQADLYFDAFFERFEELADPRSTRRRPVAFSLIHSITSSAAQPMARRPSFICRGKSPRLIIS